MNESLIAQIQKLVLSAPSGLVERISTQLERSSSWQQAHNNVMALLPSAELHDLFDHLVLLAQSSNHSPSQLAFGLKSAASVDSYHRQAQQIELVWTGPRVTPYNMRRIDEALLQLISNAQESLILISFAVYRVERLTEAIENALQRGVSVTCFFEMDDAKVTIPSVFLADKRYPAQLKLYTWADSHRPRSVTNKYGALHAKAAVADNNRLLLSSANLTEHAMSLNIEMGLSITGGELPQRVSRIFTDFVEHGIFSAVT